MGSQGGGWESVVGDLDEPEPDLEPTPTDLSPPPFAEAEPPRRPPLLDLKSGEREAAPFSLPKPTPVTSSGSSAPASPLPSPIAQDFSGGLMDRLAPTAPVPPTAKPFWIEHKEVLSSLMVVFLLVAGFLTYRVVSSSDEPEVIGTPVNRARTPGSIDLPPPAPVEPPPAAKRDPEPVPEPPPEPPAVPVLPILSVMTVPPDATIEINGLVRGKSPLVMKSPSGSAPLRMKITKNRYKTWEDEVAPNETGHFVVKVVLEER